MNPHHIRAEQFFDLHLERHRMLTEMPQDFIRPVEPVNWLPWLEAILGLPLRVKNQTVWAEPLLASETPLQALEPIWSEDWLDVTLAYVTDLVNEFHPDIPVAGPFLRGPADVVAAMLGTSRFCTELVDHPQEIERLISICVLAWIKVNRLVMEIIPEWEGGYFPGARWIHAPGKCTYSSEDATSLISRKMYEAHLLPANVHMAAGFSFGFIHRHSVSLHNIASLCKLPQHWAVEVTLDPSGPSIEQMLLVLKRTQSSRHPMIIFGISDIPTLQASLDHLLPEGLCLIVQSDTQEQAIKMLEFFARETH